ncbi:hypothetical protein BU24DRAFT_202478 [Aaosphaeria arxii CBS 175.79]|uniref:Uncharacterized protein n=1 Tax=Aaosphaeria arxii CBS 175.79 TaxID=1450172 RepID=A0A6A5XW60_9PLEO|nr:uncharacterized protein BU24DRAFT_202478 [Aaosphaeria arxii CBS 175.79]KAF2016474.1 hypothetical protein BU24DRAFT_202478 [Aaosphaeria arxii CBS 175.79]
MRMTLRSTPAGQATASAGGTGSGEPDMVLIGELLEDISRHPPALGARKLLVEHYISVGWLDAAMDNANELRRHAPHDPDVANYLAVLSKQPEPPAPEPAGKSTISVTTNAQRASTQEPPKFTASTMFSRKKPKTATQLPKDLESTKQDFAQSYTSLRQQANTILKDLLHLEKLRKRSNMPVSPDTPRIEAIVNGSNSTTLQKYSPPCSARSFARTIQSDKENAVGLSITDLESLMGWLRHSPGNTSTVDDDIVRDALVKRVRSLEAALPDDLKYFPEIALMHVQHEHLNKTYVNTETMLGDEIKDVPREDFWVTEDNYAWDMEELVQAITANGGVMRNPLSRQMFTSKDIKGIIWHPKGKQLAKLQVEQAEMSKGVRPETITQMEDLAKILLEDQSSDTLPSRHAVDLFMAYVATLPELEQKALDGLRCPAKDSHTGQSYDFTIGEAVRDAKGNRVCFHKTGDFIKQAAQYLRNNRGALPDPNDGKCITM